MSNISDLNISSFVRCWFESMVCVLHLSCVCACLQESSLLLQQASLKGELEGVHQQLESSKVLELSFFFFFQTSSGTEVANGCVFVC